MKIAVRDDQCVTLQLVDLHWYDLEPYEISYRETFEVIVVQTQGIPVPELRP